MSPLLGRVCHNLTQKQWYNKRMDPITNIPNDRKSVRPLRLVLLMGMTLLLVLLILNR